MSAIGIRRDGSAELAPSKAAKAPKPQKVSKRPSSQVVVGREPRVDLLPGEVHTDRRQRAFARRAWLGVILVLVVAILASGAAVAKSLSAVGDLAGAQSETSALLAQQSKYQEVRTVERQIAQLEAAQAVGGSTEIDWKSFVGGIIAALPQGVSIADFSIDSASPVTTFSQPTAPLQGQRIATVQLTVKSSTVPSVPEWTEKFSKVTGYTDSTISSISLGDDGIYTSTVVLHVGDEAYDGKYTGKKG